VPQEERSIFLEVMLSGILSKNMYTSMYMCLIPKGFRDRAMDVIARMRERQDALRRATCHVLARVEKCFDVDARIFENVLY
jgi:hypothetical protein